MAIYSVVVDSETRKVLGLHVGKTQPEATAGQMFVEVSKDEYRQVWLSPGEAWTLRDGEVVRDGA